MTAPTWELIPESDILGTSISDTKPLVITDENAGGVIDGIAYVVSGYVYNDHVNLSPYPSPTQTATFPIHEITQADAGTTFTITEPTALRLIAPASGQLQFGTPGGSSSPTGTPGEIALVFGQPLVAANWGTWSVTYDDYLSEDPDQLALRVICTDRIGTWNLNRQPNELVVEGLAGDYCWPYLERFDLVNKAWLSRIKLPDIDGNPYAAEGGFAGIIDGKLYFGGGDGSFISGKEFFVFDPATQEFERLSDTPVDCYGDYAPYGVLNGKLYVFDSSNPPSGRNWAFDPAVGTWTDNGNAVNAPLDHYFADQLQGIEISGKLYFVYDWVYAFDPVALTIEAKAELLHPCYAGSAWVVDSKLRFSASWTEDTIPVRADFEYNPVTNVVTQLDDIVPVGFGYTVYAQKDNSVFALSGLITGQNLAGVYSLTTNQIVTPPSDDPGVPMTQPDPNNHHNPDATTNRFTGLHPDNSYPTVNGELDLVQEMALQARQESARTRRVSTDAPHDAHPPFATQGPDRIALGRLADEHQTATPGSPDAFSS